MSRNRMMVGIAAVLTVGSGVIFAAEATEPQRAATRRLLESADRRGPSAAADAKRQFESLRTLAEDDRPARYAYGVVLVRLLKNNDAVAEFTAAARSDRGPYPPAFQAAIYLLLNTRDWPAAAGMCREFSEVLVNAPDAWETDLAWSADARRLGEFVSAAQLLVTTADDVKLWADLDVELRKGLPATLQAEYVTGFENVIVRQTELMSKFEETKQGAAEAEELQNVAALKEVVDSRQKVAAQRENLKVAAEDWKKLFDDQMTEYSKQLGKLEKDWTTLDGRRQSLERSILLAQQEVALMQQQLETLNNQNPSTGNNNNRPANIAALNPTILQTLNVQLGQRQAALIQYQFDWNRTATAQGQIQQQAVTLLKQRQAAVADYQKKSGELIAQDGQLERWNGRLTKKAAELQAPATGETPQTRALQQKLKTLGAYVPWDWEAERQRLLKALSAT